MHQAFEKLPAQKRQMIIDAAIDEFGRKGYRAASTDLITEKAGVSKGIVFYYFKNKKNLYLYTIEHSVELLLEGMLRNIRSIKSPDFFTRIKDMVLARIRATVQYPLETQLLIKAFSEIPADMEKELRQIRARQFQLVREWRKEHLFAYFDTAAIRSGVSVQSAIEFIELVFDQLGQKYLLLYKGREKELLENPRPILDELDTFIDFIKLGIFR